MLLFEIASYQKMNKGLRNAKTFHRKKFLDQKSKANLERDNKMDDIS